MQENTIKSQGLFICGSIFYGSNINYFADAQVRFEIPCPFPCASDFAINANKRKTLKNFGTMFNCSKL